MGDVVDLDERKKRLLEEEVRAAVPSNADDVERLGAILLNEDKKVEGVVLLPPPKGMNFWLLNKKMVHKFAIYLLELEEELEEAT